MNRSTAPALTNDLHPAALDADGPPGPENRNDHREDLGAPAERQPGRNYRRRGRPVKDPDPRSRDPERQAAFLEAMIRAFARRTRDDDPDIGLAALRHLQRVLREETRVSGRAAVRNYGATNVAAALGITQQTASEMWGGPGE